MEVTLTNQEIIKLAYMTKELIGYAWDSKLSNAQCNCYVECFYTIQDILNEVDKKILNKHRELSLFFAREKRLININDQLQWEKNENLKEAYMQRRLKK
ncbi:MAG TPA: hypothetical protein PLV50_13900 [Smithella sp.]|nr:hypothetical protein [Smithella sp.]MDM7987060.1 hypothetical protein [Smithella sp.]HNY51547.1 hypothetical protein [Smithella sp.]HOG91632.1 hypothetical protein [Smithella sp.]HOU49916.1 hypothetical protein [Smithella sp.]